MDSGFVSAGMDSGSSQEARPCEGDLLEKAKAAHSRAKTILKEYHGEVLSAQDVTYLFEYAQQVESLIAVVKANQPVTSDGLLLHIASSMEAMEMLWQAVTALESRLSLVEDALRKFQEDHGILLLRQMGYQVQNKIARLVLPGNPTPFAVRHENLQRLKVSKSKDSALLQRYLEKYDVEAGIAALNMIGLPVAHPGQHRLDDGEQKEVTAVVLRDLVLQHFSGSSALQSVQDVLDCLLHVTEDLGPVEPLFATTTS